MDKRNEILKAARTLFAEHGFKATNIKKITDLAGIAAGTFYLYFESKIHVFMTIFLDENVKLKRSVMERVDFDADPREVVQQVMLLNQEGMISNPILREWSNREVFAKVEQIYREEKGLDQVDFMYAIFKEIVEKWQAEGKMRNDFDSELIMAMFIAIINIDFHKDEIGIQYFPEILGYLFGFLMDGLLIKPNGDLQNG